MAANPMYQFNVYRIGPEIKIGEIDILKNEVRDSDLQKLMLSIIQEEEEPLDPKD